MTSAFNDPNHPKQQSQTPLSRTVMSPVFEAPNRVGEPLSLVSDANSLQKMSATTILPPITLPPVPSHPPVINNVVKRATLSVVPMTAEDNDNIEKEWVNKAKQIVEGSRDDPHRQSKELTLYKADYIQKRYNKTIKMVE